MPRGKPAEGGVRSPIRSGRAGVRATRKRAEAPQLFRVLLKARNLGRSRRFYESLLGTRGRLVARGRVYFDCGPVLLGILDYSSRGRRGLSPPTEALYFATHDLEGIFRRARRLGALSPGLIHGDPSSPLGQIVVRPWGERSFYANDPSGNPLCFVDARTLFTGTPRQVAALNRS
jgi:catechol 2,3-dioxygenase-like lactoylglutathione lyase family enzyme